MAITISGGSGTNTISGQASGVSVDSTGALTIPVGTTAQRPGTPANGMTRMNTSLGYPEWYDTATSAWVPMANFPNYSIDYLIVAGGGAGGNNYGGGGGAGGYLASTASVTPSIDYSIVIGAGGTGTASDAYGTNGVNTTALGLTAVGGGAGGAYTTATTRTAGVAGGSGGGGSILGAGGNTGAGGAATSGQGNTGGSGLPLGSGKTCGGGGGGAGAVG